MRDKIVDYVSDHSKIIFTGRVIDNNDYQVLSRIRVFPDHESVQQILDSYKDKGIVNEDGSDILDEFKFTNLDPFVFLPLIPFSITMVPEVGELVWLMYSNPEKNTGRKEQFYIPGPKSNPFNISSEDYSQSLSQTAQGSNIQGSPNLKTPTSEYRNQKIKGIFAEVGVPNKLSDIAIYGKGSSDIIIKPNELLIRAGKTSEITPNTTPYVNEKRGFYQISYFSKDVINQPSENAQISETDESPLSKLIEYDIIQGLDNNANSYTGAIYIYDIPASSSVKNNEFKENTELPSSVTTPIFTYQFVGIPQSGVTFLINLVIEGLNTGAVDIKSPYIPKLSQFSGQRFPFYYRPSKNLRSIMSEITSPENLTIKTNLLKITSLVKFSKANIISYFLSEKGCGLVSQFNKFGISKKNITISTNPYETVLKKNSVSVGGSNKMIFLSHDSVIPGKQKINLGSDSVYGITQSKIFDEIIPNTEPMVRGEKLKEFLNLVVKFLITHSHPYHMLPPSPVTSQGTTSAEIEIEFQNFDSKVLNQNIRIN